MRPTLLALVALALLAAPGTAGAHYMPAGMNCGTITFTPNTDAGASSIYAKGTSCRTARRIVKSFARGNTRPLGFTCAARARTDGDGALELAHDDVRCKRGKKMVTFART
jgi:hypothetical protein